jgi:alkanesulfonate monooxygenase SsuD/methylene tetrahydromethanopterin reductase-like flavin-dependent oxidoreductase (luciferase family)
LRSGAPLPADPSIEQYIDAGLMFVGTPDEVYAQLERFYVDVGGFGNLLMMGQAGTLSHADTADNLTLFAKEVMPRLETISLDAPNVHYEAFA